jgi:hypothetical protein
VHVGKWRSPANYSTSTALINALHGDQATCLSCHNRLLQTTVCLQVASRDTPELDMDICLQLMSWNKEAVQRALKLSAPGKAARNCRALFHHLLPPAAASALAASAAPSQAAAGGSVGGSVGGVAEHVVAHPVAHPGCLLEQLARLVVV